MAKLYFKYGAMGSSKTAAALMTRFNYIERGQSPLLAKPARDKRDGEKVIRSRVELEAKCEFIEDIAKYPSDRLAAYDVIIVDEAQFLTPEQVDFLSDVVDFVGVPVICYGLRADFRNKLFPGSERLLAIADKIEEIKTMCWCGSKAICNVRLDKNGNKTTSGEQFKLGGNKEYTSLCRKHYKRGQLQER